MEVKSKDEIELEVLLASREVLLHEGRNNEFLNEKIRALTKKINESKKEQE